MAKLKLAVVDDEISGRNMIKSLLEDNPDYEVLESFSCGVDALRWLRDNDVDILLCDMELPDISGVELMHSIRELREFLPIIVISSFDNFDYVRGSLINGAANYLLKHELTKEYLLSVLNEVRDRYRISTEQGRNGRKIGHCITDPEEYRADHIRELMDGGAVCFADSGICILAVSPDYLFPLNTIPSVYMKTIMNVIEDILAQILGREYPYLIFRQENGHIIVLVSFAEFNSTLYIMNAMKHLVKRMSKQSSLLLSLTMTIIAEDIPSSLETAVEKSLVMERQLKDKLYLGTNRIQLFQKNSGLTYTDRDLPEAFWRELSFDLSSGCPRSEVTIREMLEWMKKERLPLDKIRAAVKKILTLISETYADAVDDMAFLRVGLSEIMEQFQDELRAACEKMFEIRIKEKGAYSKSVAGAIIFIEQNYTGEVSLEACADRLSIGYSTLSRAFKRETGKGFVEYLNDCRIMHAKSMMIRGEMPIREIVKQAGFGNYNYFFRVFKDAEGMTPAEFLEQTGGKA